MSFWSAANVAREALRMLHDKKKLRGGRLLQAFGMAGMHAMAGVGYTAARKCCFSIDSRVVN